MNENSFEFATIKQYKLAETVKKRIINDIANMDNINKFNQVTNTNYEKAELINFFKEKDDFKYLIFFIMKKILYIKHFYHFINYTLASECIII